MPRRDMNDDGPPHPDRPPVEYDPVKAAWFRGSRLTVRDRPEARRERGDDRQQQNQR
jgi:hypothetical protein